MKTISYSKAYDLEPIINHMNTQQQVNTQQQITINNQQQVENSVNIIVVASTSRQANERNNLQDLKNIFYFYFI